MADQSTFDDSGEICDSDGNVVTEADIGHELDRFRQHWYQEIHSQRNETLPSGSVSQHNASSTKVSAEDQAHCLFLEGVHAEQSGRLYDAIWFYRKAVQLVPDIESRIDFQLKRRDRVREESESSVGLSDTGDADDNLTDLFQRFQRVQCVDSPAVICQPDEKQKVVHIGELPVEILQYIFKWVVSIDLDIYSLEQLACVCRGFYLSARDEELWKLVCLRIWGINCGSSSKYGSYRNMYIERPHLRFNGCYISKCVYYRNGEKGLDNYYQPFHRVEYYRYIRFFPEGKVLMVTSPDNPHVVLPNLHRSCAIQGLLTGYYKLTGDRVTMVLKKVSYPTDNQPSYRYRRLKANAVSDCSEHTFDAEFTVDRVRDRPHWQLIWTHYAVRTRNRMARDETVSDFDLNNKSYPPLYFSRVRSFTSVARLPLC